MKKPHPRGKTRTEQAEIAAAASAPAPPPTPVEHVPLPDTPPSIINLAGLCFTAYGVVWALLPAPAGMEGMALYRNGVWVPHTQRIIRVIWTGRTIFQENQDHNWWAWNGEAWVPGPAPVGDTRFTEWSLTDPKERLLFGKQQFWVLPVRYEGKKALAIAPATEADLAHGPVFTQEELEERAKIGLDDATMLRFEDQRSITAMIGKLMRLYSLRLEPMPPETPVAPAEPV